MFNLDAIQSALRSMNLDAWLLYDFRGINPLARRVLGMETRPLGSRRFFYLIPANGPPRKLVHRIESAVLDHLPGDKHVYLTRTEFETNVTGLVANLGKVAMEYSPRNAVPTLSRVDAGTVEQVRAAGATVVSSGDLVQLFEATWDDEQWQMHLEAEKGTLSAFDLAWGLIAKRTRNGGTITEKEVQTAIMDHFRQRGLTASYPASVAVGPHSGDPHYETGLVEAPIKAGDFVLIDLWAKADRPRSVYSDLTRLGFVGDKVPDKFQEIFHIVAKARDAGINLVRDSFAKKRPLQGWEVDAATRRVIEEAGYGDKFIHRTGHGIGAEVHGNGANMDNFETHEERLVMARTCFSIEPGIYLPEFGVRSEVNVFVDMDGGVHVTGNPQTTVTAVLKEY